MTSEDAAVNGKLSMWRRAFWPFQREDFSILLPIMLIKFSLSVNYSILVCMKDALVVTSQGSGAEAIVILKGWFVLPISFLFAIFYYKLGHLIGVKSLFYTMVTLFLAVIFFYGFVLYPMEEIFSPRQSAEWFMSRFDGRYSNVIAIYRNWIHALLFVIAELWGSVIILLTFWGFVNAVTSVKDAKRSYSFYVASGNMAPMLVSPLVYFLTRINIDREFYYIVQILVTIIMVFGIISIIAFWYVTKEVSKRDDLSRRINSWKSNNMPTLNSLRITLKSRYLLGIAIMVICYGLSINLVEVTWKGYLQQLYPTPAYYQKYIACVMFLVGLFAFLSSILFSNNLIRYFGWRISAQVAPTLIGSTGVLFFLIIILNSYITPLLSLFGVPMLTFIVSVGAFQNIISKVVKYSFFDPIKEIAYLPLSQESKFGGKAAIDLCGSRVGKSLSSWIQIFSINFIGNGSLFSISTILLALTFAVSLLWFVSVNFLSKEFEHRVSSNKA